MPIGPDHRPVTKPRQRSPMQQPGVCLETCRAQQCPDAPPFVSRMCPDEGHHPPGDGGGCHDMEGRSCGNSAEDCSHDCASTASGCTDPRGLYAEVAACPSPRGPGTPRTRWPCGSAPTWNRYDGIRPEHDPWVSVAHSSEFIISVMRVRTLPSRTARSRPAAVHMRFAQLKRPAGRYPVFPELNAIESYHAEAAMSRLRRQRNTSSRLDLDAIARYGGLAGFANPVSGHADERRGPTARRRRGDCFFAGFSRGGVGVPRRRGRRGLPSRAGIVLVPGR